MVLLSFTTTSISPLACLQMANLLKTPCVDMASSLKWEEWSQTKRLLIEDRWAFAAGQTPKHRPLLGLMYI